MPMTNPLGRLYDIAEAFIPVDMQTAANNGDWVAVRNAMGISALFFAAVGTNGDDPSVTFKQALTNAGGSSKAITPTSIHKKQAATNTQTTTTWTDASSEVTAGVWLNTDAAEQVEIVHAYFDASAFDVANGFKWFQVSVPDIGGNAQLGCALYIMVPAYPSKPTQNITYLT